MATAKRGRQPQDRLPKQTGEPEQTGPIRSELDGETWRFTVDDGETWYDSLPLSEVFTPRWARVNRRRPDMDAMYTAIEDAFDGDDAALEAWDTLTFREQSDLSAGLFKAMGSTLGE